jgi:hypothetical protein
MGKSLREKRVEFTKNSIELHTTDKGIWQYLSDKYSSKRIGNGSINPN